MTSSQTPPGSTRPQPPPGHNPYMPPAANTAPLPPLRPQVANHLVWAILTTLFCCLPAGIVSIVYASKVDKLLALGDIEGARQASKNAATWAIVSAAVIGVLVGIWMLLVLIGVGMEILGNR